MADIFISYSRKDSAFVRKVHDELAKHGRDIWIDWEDIPLSADWWREIRENIESADTFVFVISPDSIASQVCRDEIQYAADNNKRIIPILHRDISTLSSEQIHPAIKTYNWIQFGETVEFATGVANILKTLDTDLDYVRAHTRLLVRARDWDAKGRKPDALLNDSALREYRTWLETSEQQRDPKPNELQLQYLMSSEGAYNRRQRLRLLTLLVASLVTFIFLSLSFVQNQRTLEAQATNVAFQSTNEQQRLILTQAQATSEAIRLQATLQQGTNEARQTAIRQEQDERIREVQATLTQQAETRGTATSIVGTLQAIQEQQGVIDAYATEFFSTRIALEQIATLFAQPSLTPPPTLDGTLIFAEAATRVAADFFLQATLTTEAELQGNIADAQTKDAQSLSPTLSMMFTSSPTQDMNSSDAPTNTPTLTPSPLPTLTPSASPTLTPSETPTATPTLIPSETPTLTPSELPSPTTALTTYTDRWFVSASGNDANTCNAPEIPCQTINGALAQAQAGHIIQLEAGIYFERLTLNKEVIIWGNDPNLTIISADGTGTTVQVDNVRAKLIGVNITGGTAEERGGGILNQGILTLENVIVSGNTSNGAGGGIANLNTLILDKNSVVTNNYARWAGGIYNAYDAHYLSIRAAQVGNNTSAINLGNDVYEDGCSDEIKALRQEALNVCSTMGLSQVCYVAPDVTLTPREGFSPRWVTAGNIVEARQVSSLLFETENKGLSGAQGAILTRLQVGASLLPPSDYAEILVRGAERLPISQQPLHIGGQAMVDTGFGTPLNVRETAGLSSIITAMVTGEVVTIVEGPQQADGFTWWKVKLASGIEGWSAERVERFATLVPVETGGVHIGARYWVMPQSGRGLNLRQAAGVNSPLIRLISRGRDVSVIDGPVEVDGVRWWKVYAPYVDEEGWLAEQAENASTLTPIFSQRIGIAQVSYSVEGVCMPYEGSELRLPTLRSLDREISLELRSELPNQLLSD